MKLLQGLIKISPSGNNENFKHIWAENDIYAKNVHLMFLKMFPICQCLGSLFSFLDLMLHYRQKAVNFAAIKCAFNTFELKLVPRTTKNFPSRPQMISFSIGAKRR